MPPSAPYEERRSMRLHALQSRCRVRFRWLLNSNPILLPLVLLHGLLLTSASQLGPDVIYGEEDPVIQPAAPKALNVAVIGPANAGKSTWTNRMCGARVTPVSSKPQTTRERMCGVATIENTQLVIYDTPGLLSDMDRKAYALPSN